MTVLEILEAHKPWSTGHVLCECRLEFKTDKEHRKHIAEVVDQHIAELEQQMLQLLVDLVDPGKCWFDHHGGCQEHGYLDLEPGELCPHEEAKRLLKAGEEDGQEGTAEADHR